MEQRLIDANNVISVLQNIKNSLDGAPANPVDIRAVILAVMDIVKEQPAVDAVPVVRCGACRYYNTDDCAMVDYCDGCDCKVDLRFDESGFCSHAEPRTPPAE